MRRGYPFARARLVAPAMLTALTVLATPVPAVAGNNFYAFVALHAQAHTTKSTTVCTTQSPLTKGIPCHQFATQWPTNTNADVYVVVARADSGAGVAGVSFGIMYDSAPGSGAHVFGWSLCADEEFPAAGLNGSWPAPGSGNEIRWDPATHCQRTVIAPDGVHAVAGAFYVYAYGDGVLYTTPRNDLPEPQLLVFDCSGNSAWLAPNHNGEVSFGPVGGTPPCVEWGPVEGTRWGAIKARYRR